jgi:hypothetical protein
MNAPRSYDQHADEINAAIAALIMLGDSFTNFEGNNALREANNSTSLAWLMMMGYVIGAGERRTPKTYQGIKQVVQEPLSKVSPMGLRYLSL